MLRFALFTLAMSLFVSPTASAQSLAEMAGQMVIVGFEGDEAGDPGVTAVRDQIARGEIGGVIFFARNVAGLGEVRAINAALREAAPGAAPLLSIDQEGGRVQRLTGEIGFPDTPSARALARLSPEAARASYDAMAGGLAAEGFNLNFGPVVDLAINSGNPAVVRYGRSYGAGAESVAAYAAAFIAAHRNASVMTALKHFPGHGSSLGDTHEGFVDITDVWSPAELEPFRILIGQGMADMVMAGHLFHADYGGEEGRLPATLSPEWIEGVLRSELGYDGVVVSDDMEMGAIREHFSLRDSIVNAVMAGNDILLFSNTAAYDPELGPRIRDILAEEAEADPAFSARIEQSYRRILALKARFGLA